MAVINSDGSIILSTKVDTSGLAKGMSQIDGRAAGLTKTFSKLAAAIASAFAIQRIIQFTNQSASLATQTEASIQRLVDIYGSASDAVGNFIDQNARALGMSKSAAASFSSVYGNLFSAFADQETNAALTNEYLQMTAVVASKTGRTVEDVQERIRSGLLGNTEAIEDLGIFVNVKTIEMTDAFQRMAGGKSWEQLDAYTQQQIRSMAILEQATAKYGNEVTQNSTTIRNQFNAAYQDFQNSWGNIVNTVLLPVLQVLTHIFDIAAKGLNALSGKSGKTLENVELQEKSTNKIAENINTQAENQKKLNKEIKKSIAGFDDIQILSSQSGASATETQGFQFSSSAAEATSSGDRSDASVVDEINGKILMLAETISGAMLAIGCILLAFGQIGWGIGLIAAGAAAQGMTEAATGQETDLKDVVDKISNAVVIAGVVAIVLGILLCMASMWGMGIKLISIGALSVAGSVVANWDAITEKVLYVFTEFAGIIAGAGVVLIVIGIILCCTGVGIGLGIGLILAGAAAIGGVVAVNWDAIVDWVKGAWDAVKQFWNKHIAPIFTKEWWLNLAKKIGNGLITGFENAINGIISLFEKMINWIVGALNKISFDVPDWVPGIGGKTFGFNIPEVKFGRVSIPRLAQGAVIPPNREFLAVLGDQKQGVNIEAPLQTIVDAFNIALAQNGGNFGGGNTEVVLEIDGREFGRAVVEQGNRENRRIGTRLVIA